MQNSAWMGVAAGVLTASVLASGCSIVNTPVGTPVGTASASDMVVAGTWWRKVKPGVTIAEIEEAFASVAAEDNIRHVGDLPISKEIELRSAKPEKFLKIYSYCDPAAARQMVDFSPNMAAFMPCRIAVVEQDDGYWIYTMNMDMLIKTGRTLPPQVSMTMHRMRATLLKMLDRGAAGEF